MHVAIIPDGNRRWAKKRGLAATQGHLAAVKGGRTHSFLKKAKELNVAQVSLWVFSTDNWKRSKIERNELFKILLQEIKELHRIAAEKNIRVRWLGRRDRAPESVFEALKNIEEETKDNTALSVQLCFDYGGRDELLRAINQAVKKGEEVTEETFSQLLDTNDIPDPDLIIRTSGEQRLSGFFPWQGTYAELYFTKKHFPDFGPDDLTEAVEQFRSRQRRFGGD